MNRRDALIEALLLVNGSISDLIANDNELATVEECIDDVDKEKVIRELSQIRRSIRRRLGRLMSRDWGDR